MGSFEWLHGAFTGQPDNLRAPAVPDPGERLVRVAPHAGPYELRRVGTLVNSPRNDVPEVLRPVEGG